MHLPDTEHLNPHEQVVLVQTRSQGSVNNAAVQALTGLHRADISVLLTKLRDKGFLTQESTRRWASYRLSDQIKALATEKPSHKIYVQKSMHKTGKSRQKKQGIIGQILEYCRVARTAREIAESVHKNQTYLVGAYLGPLIKDGLLQYTNPSRPNARNQKYVVVEK